MTGITILYVMGYGRSGSTLLDRVLGSYEGVAGCGELSNIVESGWINDEYCSCGHKVSKCKFWSDVYSLWSFGKQAKDEKEFHSLQKKYESHESFWKSVTYPNVTRSHEFECYLHDLGLLYSCIREVSGNDMIVDSSKNVARAYNLSLLPCVSVKWLHLVRDCRGVVSSLEKTFTQDLKKGVQRSIGGTHWMRTILAWSIYNYECEILKKRIQSDSILIKYEDFSSNPSDELKRIGDIIDVPALTSETWDRFSSSQNDTHIAAGNRLRMQNEIVINPDNKWHTTLPEWKKQSIRIFASHLMRKYRYF